MDSSSWKPLFEVVAMMAVHLFDAIKQRDKKELKRIAEVWPKPIKARLALLALEEEARHKVGLAGHDTDKDDPSWSIEDKVRK